MNISEILIKKAEYPVRLIAKEKQWIELNDGDFIYHEVGDEIGIEAIDFSAGYIRCCNKSEERPNIFDINYDKISGDLDGKWEIKPKN